VLHLKGTYRGDGVLGRVSYAVVRGIVPVMHIMHCFIAYWGAVVLYSGTLLCSILVHFYIAVWYIVILYFGTFLYCILLHCYIAFWYCVLG
jgi:hypothetical protein